MALMIAAIAVMYLSATIHAETPQVGDIAELHDGKPAEM
jgi:hypothetical protein